MTDILDTLIACERAEQADASFAYKPEIWREARLEIERLREALKIGVQSREDWREYFKSRLNAHYQTAQTTEKRFMAKARAALGEGK